jgi:hypothetical protein
MLWFREGLTTIGSFVPSKIIFGGKDGGAIWLGLDENWDMTDS